MPLKSLLLNHLSQPHGHPALHAWLNPCARACGLLRRSARKLHPADLLRGLLAQAAGGSLSLSSIAADSGSYCSAQNIAKRLGAPCVLFLQDILQSLLRQQLLAPPASKSSNASNTAPPFARILVEDSSQIAAHASLARHLPGCGNQHGTNAAIKIHLAFDLLSGQSLYCDLQAARTQDRSLAPKLLAHLRGGDLVLRDMGFSKLELFAKIDDLGAFFINRLHRQTCVYDEHGRPLDLARWVAKNRAARSATTLRIEAQLGDKQRFATTLILSRIPAEARRRRIAQLRCEHNLGPRDQLSRQQCFQCDWSVLMTNIDQSLMDSAAVAALYRSRWQVELIFKAFKQDGMRDKLAAKATNEHHWQALVLARMILALLSLTLPLELELDRKPRTANGAVKTLYASVAKVMREFCDWLRACVMCQSPMRMKGLQSRLKRYAMQTRRTALSLHQRLWLCLG